MFVLEAPKTHRRRAAEKLDSGVVLSEAKNLSVVRTQIEERFFASLRMTKYFFRSLFSPWMFVLAVSKTRRLKPALLEMPVEPLPS